MKVKVFIAFCMLTLVATTATYAATNVTQRANATICAGSSFYSIGTIIVSEGDNNDFVPITPRGYYRLRLPADFEFDPSAPIQFRYTGNAANWVNHTLANPYYNSNTEIEFAYELFANADNEQATFEIIGLRVRCNSAGASGNIVRITGTSPDGTTAGLSPTANVNHGTLTSRLSMTLNGSANPSTACRSGGSYFVVTWPSTPISGATYELYHNGSMLTTSTFGPWGNTAYIYLESLPGTGSNVTFTAVISGSGCTYWTNNVVIGNVVGDPAAGVLTGVSPPTFNTFGDPVPMSTYILPAANTNITYMYSTKDDIYSPGIGGSGFNFFFLPGGAGKGTHRVHYRVQDSTTNCYAYFEMPQNFVVVDPLTPPPSFISPKTTPICENGGYYKFTFTAPDFSPDLESVTFHYAGGDSILNNPTTSSELEGYLNPTKQSNFIIPVTIRYRVLFTSLTQTQRDTFYIFPKREVDVNGLPDPEFSDPDTDVDTVYICSASRDTITLRGLPAAGNFNFYMIYRSTPTIKRWTNNNLGTPYSSSDPATYKFVPNILFSRSDKANSTDSIYFLIMYTYPALGGGLCPVTKYIYIKFRQPTDLSYQILQPASTPYCFGDEIQLSGLTLPNLPVLANDSLNYTFGDGFNTGWVPASRLISHTYREPGQYNLRVKTLRQGALCNNDHLTTIRIGSKPTPDFEVHNNLEGEEAEFTSLSEIEVANRTNIADTMSIWEWDFGVDNTSRGTNTFNADTVYTFATTRRDPYRVVLKITNGWGCQDSVVRYIPAFPIQQPRNATPYTENFNNTTANNGWFESGQYNLENGFSSWENRTPPGPYITSDNPCWITSGAKGAVTDTTGYYNHEHSWIESPCIDLDSLELPMLSFYSWVHADNLFDGATVQYTLVDSAFGEEKWITLGRRNSGIGWYNSNTIISSPGGEPASGSNLFGWTGDDTTNTWTYSAYSLNEIKDTLENHPGVEYVRIRIGFSSNGDNTPEKNFDGFAVDSLYIGQRNRQVLVEEFCDYEFYNPATPALFLDPQAIRIQYHLSSLNSDDDINNQNKAEPSARALLYGIGKALPRGVIDGIYSDNNREFHQWGPDEFFKRSLWVSPFNINVAWDTTGGRLNVTGTITKITNQAIPGPFVVQIAIVERSVNGNGEPQPFTNVLRNMIPNSAGQRVPTGYDWSTPRVVNGSWSPFVEPGSDLMAIVFIQDENTKEVYQSNYIDVPLGAVEDLPIGHKTSGGNTPVLPLSFTEVELSPNPTSGDVKLLFNGVLSASYQYIITDALGKPVKKGSISKGGTAAIIDAEELTGGFYHLELLGEGQRIVKKFSVIK